MENGKEREFHGSPPIGRGLGRTRPEENRRAKLGWSADRSRPGYRPSVAGQGRLFRSVSFPKSCSGNWDCHPSHSRGFLHPGFMSISEHFAFA